MATITTNIASSALKKLFDEQIKIVLAKGLAPETELTPLFGLLGQIGEVKNSRGYIPFVIVVQEPTLTLSRRMEKLEFNGKTGVNHFTSFTDQSVIDISPVPHINYLMVGVEDGRSNLNIEAKLCLEEFAAMKRFGATVVEGITMASYYPEILDHHYLNLPGSLWNDEMFKEYLIPGISLRYGRKPTLDAGRGRNRNFGSVSCGRRIGITK